VIVPGAAARRRAACAGASSRAEQASRTGESAAALGEVLDEREGVVVGPVQVLQAQHAAGGVAEREAQQPQQALGEDDDGSALGLARRSPRRAGPAGQQPGRARRGRGAARGRAGRVVEEADHRAGDRPERPAALHRPPGQHRQPALAARAGDLVEQAGLADPGLAGDEQRPPPPGGDGVDEPAGGRELGGRGRPRRGCGRAGRRPGRRPRRQYTVPQCPEVAATTARLGTTRNSPQTRRLACPPRVASVGESCVGVRESSVAVRECAGTAGRGGGHPPVPALRHGDRAPLPHVLAAARPAPPAAGPSLAEILGGRGGALDASAAPAAFVAGSGSPTRGQPVRPAVGRGGGARRGLVRRVPSGSARGKRPPRCWPGCSGWRSRCSSPSTRAGGRLLPAADRLERRERAGLGGVDRRALAAAGPGRRDGAGQRTRWRRDPDLLRGYRRASWVWVGQYLLRLAVFIPLYLAGRVYALGIARVALTWPLVVACIALSWPVLRRALPPGIPGCCTPGCRTRTGATVQWTGHEA
jgi:hypothetical protein